MREYYVHYNGAAYFVKDGAFFREQGGLTSKWGKEWTQVFADSIEHARDKAKLLRIEGKLYGSR